MNFDSWSQKTNLREVKKKKGYFLKISEEYQIVLEEVFGYVKIVHL